MKVEGIENINSYYASVYNKNTGKISSDSETDDGAEFDDVYSFSTSDINCEEKADPQRKKGTYSQVITLPDGTRYLITTMYFCGQEIKITKKLPPVDEKNAEEDSLLRQDDEEEDAIRIDVQKEERNIKENAEKELLDSFA